LAKALAKSLTPATHHFVGDDDAPLGQQEFNVAQAEAEHMVQPNGMLMISAGKRRR
jgi:hypothetical protein